jgi:2-iminobutanoate/2-iminopropanoate deaminase
VPIEIIQGLPPTVGLYSHAVAVPAGSRLLFVSGQLSVDDAGNSTHVGDFGSQMRNVFGRLLSVITAAGGTAADVVKMTTYLVDAVNVADFYAVRAQIFATMFPDRGYPGNTLLVVSRLVRPEFLIEIEAVAAVN